MKKREKIIFGLALVAALYGLIDFFILSNKDKSNQTGVSTVEKDIKTQDFAEKCMVAISKIEMAKMQNEWQILMSKIESEWEHDPFVQSLISEQQEELSVADIIYSGFIIAGNNVFAVINGIEYKSGELIKKYEYKVMNITPHKIILQKNLKKGTVFLKEN